MVFWGPSFVRGPALRIEEPGGGGGWACGGKRVDAGINQELGFGWISGSLSHVCMYVYIYICR